MPGRIVLTREEKEQILLGNYGKPAPVVYVRGSRTGDALTAKLCAEQQWRCFWCGELMNEDRDSPRYRTKDHIIPLSTSKQGVKRPENIRAVCRECNAIRGEFASLIDYRKYVKRVEDQLRQCQIALHRHKTTMGGRCYYCKWRFHLREWWHKINQV